MMPLNTPTQVGMPSSPRRRGFDGTCRRRGGRGATPERRREQSTPSGLKSHDFCAAINLTSSGRPMAPTSGQQNRLYPEVFARSSRAIRAPGRRAIRGQEDTVPLRRCYREHRTARSQITSRPDTMMVGTTRRKRFGPCPRSTGIPGQKSQRVALLVLDLTPRFEPGFVVGETRRRAVDGR